MVPPRRDEISLSLCFYQTQFFPKKNSPRNFIVVEFIFFYFLLERKKIIYIMHLPIFFLFCKFASEAIILVSALSSRPSGWSVPVDQGFRPMLRHARTPRCGAVRPCKAGRGGPGRRGKKCGPSRRIKATPRLA